MHYLLLIILLLWGLPAYAQRWQADWSATGHPTSPPWRYDRTAFLQEGGRLRLAVSDSLPAGSVLLATSVTLPEHPCWRGIVHLDLRPTRQNHPLLLLCATEARGEDAFDYLALDFGGRVPQRASLVLVTATRTAGGTPHISPREDIAPLLIAPQTLTAGQALSFAVVYQADEGWQLFLQDLTAGERLTRAGSAPSYRPKLSAKNTLAIACTFTAKGRHAWNFRDFSLQPFTAEDLQPAPPPTEVPAPASSLLLSEVMAHPRSDAPEYIELYNPSDSATTLTGGLLYAGTNEDHLHASPLPTLTLPAHSFALLTQEEQALRHSYAQLPADALVVSVPLPRLPNRAGLILLADDEGHLIDQMSYSPDLLPRGLKTKAGIALERTDIHAPEGAPRWQPALAEAGYATPGLPPATRGASPADASSDEGLSAVLRTLAASPANTCRWTVYTLSGQCLAQGEGDAGKAFLLTLRSTPQQFFERLTAGHLTQLLLLRLQLRLASGESSEGSYLLRYSPR